MSIHIETTEAQAVISKPETRLFSFTKQEETEILKAIIESAKFFKKYGRGRKPILINLDNYYQ